MTYPSWAPKVLTDERERRKEFQRGLEHINSVLFWTLNLPDPDRQQYMPEGKLESSLNFAKSNEVLDKLITDQRMDAVWKSLARRSADKGAYISFWWASEQALVSWHYTSKLSDAERRKICDDIQHCAARLQHLIEESMAFQDYSIADQFSEQSIANLRWQWTQDEMRNYQQIHSTTKTILRQEIPTINMVLMDIQEKARQHSEEKPLVLKPRSENAALHHFARTISGYLKSRYGQPLHEVVANTAAVILDLDEVDPELVRKLVTK
jgi:hypothetical protein